MMRASTGMRVHLSHHRVCITPKSKASVGAGTSVIGAQVLIVCIHKESGIACSDDHTADHARR